MKSGDQLTPNLRLLRCVAEGGMGSVWIAEHSGLGAEVAVKLLSPLATEDLQTLERFRREAMAAARIKSPHIAQVFDNGVTDDGRPYIVMELLEGEDLQHHIDRVGRLDPLQVVAIVRQICRALTRAHSVGIVHRDIKPGNIFLQNIDGDLHVKVLDFGVAKLPVKKEHDVSISGYIVGTPFYMSPQQLKSSKHVDAKSDLWSLAVVVYQALTGTFPFPGRSLPELFVSVNSGKFSPPSAHNEDLPPAVDGWFERAFRRDPLERFGSAREMALALEEAITGTSRLSEPQVESLKLYIPHVDRQYPADAPTLAEVPSPDLEAEHAEDAPPEPDLAVDEPRSAPPPVDITVQNRVRAPEASRKTVLFVVLVAVLVAALIAILMR
jgi:eukaryotic-like serine/threonine-protein kinase